MGAAALNIKTVIKNVDDHLLKPMGESFYYWNMQFNPKQDVVGDLEVHALGTESVMRKEVRSQRLIQFLQVVSNPVAAPFAKIHNVIKEIASSMDLEPDEFANDTEEAMIFAQILGTANAVAGGGGAQGQNSQQQIPTNADPNQLTGAPPGPDEQGFSGSGQQGGLPQPAKVPPTQMEKEITYKLLTLVHDPKWEIFQEWVDREEKIIVDEFKRAETSEMAFASQGKLKLLDRLRCIKDVVMLQSQIDEETRARAAEEKQE